MLFILSFFYKSIQHRKKVLSKVVFRSSFTRHHSPWLNLLKCYQHQFTIAAVESFYIYMVDWSYA